jgi:hypothetical protein
MDIGETEGLFCPNGGRTMDDKSRVGRCVALIEEHHRWAMSIGNRQAMKFDAVTCGHGLNQEDLAAEAMVGLVKAAKSYDPGSGVPFQAYAIHRIRGQSPTPPDAPTRLPPDVGSGAHGNRRPGHRVADP